LFVGLFNFGGDIDDGVVSSPGRRRSSQRQQTDTVTSQEKKNNLSKNAESLSVLPNSN